MFTEIGIAYLPLKWVRVTGWTETDFRCCSPVCRFPAEKKTVTGWRVGGNRLSSFTVSLLHLVHFLWPSQHIYTSSPLLSRKQVQLGDKGKDKNLVVCCLLMRSGAECVFCCLPDKDEVKDKRSKKKTVRRKKKQAHSRKYVIQPQICDEQPSTCSPVEHWDRRWLNVGWPFNSSFFKPVNISHFHWFRSSHTLIWLGL